MNTPLPAPGPVDVGIVAALPIEVDPLRDLMRDVRTYADPEGRRRPVVEGMIGDKLVAMVVAGMGQAPAARGVRRLLDGHRPRRVVSAGFGGALDPSLRRNDVVFIDEVVDGAEASPAPVAVDLVVPDPPAGSKGRFTSGRLVTTPAIVRTAAEKAELRRRTGADVVDMETVAVARACAERGVRFLGLRVISDEAGTDVPSEVLAVMGPSGSFRLGATLGALWRRPGSVKDLWTLREHAIEAADRLAEVLPGILARLN